MEQELNRGRCHRSEALTGVKRLRWLTEGANKGSLGRRIVRGGEEGVAVKDDLLIFVPAEGRGVDVRWPAWSIDSTMQSICWSARAGRRQMLGSTS